MRTLFFLVMSAVLALASIDTAQAASSCPIAGRYLVKGLMTGNVSQYTGEAVVSDNGSGCNVRWLPPNTSEGSGTYANGVLTVHYVLSGDNGVVRYSRTANGELRGQFWSERNPSYILGTESLTPETRQAIAAQNRLDTLLDQIVTQDSKSWGFFHYIQGSMHNSYVKQRSGRTVVMHGDYNFNGGASGWVNVKMVDGRIDCVEFWNEGNCRRLGFSPTMQFMQSLRDSSRDGGGQHSGGSSYQDQQVQQNYDYDRARQQQDNTQQQVDRSSSPQ